MPPTTRDDLARSRAEQFNGAFLEWLDDAACLVVNRPRAMRSNVSKPYQLQLVAETGMPVPATLVTNRPEESACSTPGTAGSSTSRSAGSARS